MVKIKLCGFTREEDVEVACTLKPDMIGTIVEIPGSPRSLTTGQAKRVLGVVGGDIATVAVTRLNELEAGVRIARDVKPDYLQVHSTFSATELEELKERANVELIAVVAIPRNIRNFPSLLQRALEVSKVADYLLVDTRGPTGGGTGLTHDWNLSAKIRTSIPKPMFLAGGLNPSNVGDAVRTVHPYGVDVASGIESSPGKKDFELMRAFIEAARRA